MSTSAIRERDALPRQKRLIPIAAASDRLGVSVWMLKRMFNRGVPLPVAFAEGKWLIHESFIEDFLAPLCAGEVRRLEDFAARWSAAHGAEAVA